MQKSGGGPGAVPESYEWLPDFLRRVREVEAAGYGFVTVEIVKGKAEMLRHQVDSRIVKPEKITAPSL
ncbi:MAG: hypothetical protein HOO67_06425 [Candidatus Peribacteraceae bacterium]|nr:hypothetical protein [Candidatus Peribacteraceae bacterium]